MSLSSSYLFPLPFPFLILFYALPFISLWFKATVILPVFVSCSSFTSYPLAVPIWLLYEAGFLF